LRKFGLVAFAVAFSLVWSSAFVAGKVALARFDPATLLTLRFGLSALLLAPFASPGAARIGLIAGALNNALYLGLTFWALQLTRPVVVVAIVSCAPFVTGLIAAATGVERVRLTQFLGFALGLIGVGFITGFDFGGANAEGLALAAGGVVAFSIATLVIRSKAGGLSAPALTFWQSLAGAFLLAPIALANGRARAEIGAAGWFEPSALALFYLVIVATLIGMAMWIGLVRLIGAAEASACHLMNPFFGALLAWCVLDQPLRPADFLGGAAIAAGLALGLDLGRRRARSARI
jgi:drug/metabolite transporter (DMT)-like permease